jgi:lipopolysaccharide export system permease protein
VFTTFDRYLFNRFIYAFVALFIASVGLFAVVDGFMNLDAFQKEAGDGGTMPLLFSMGRHYVIQSSVLLDLLGPTACVLAVLTTMALLMKHGELHPLLAAGVPTYRLALPFVAGVLAVNGLMIANQELVIPRVAAELQGGHGSDAEGSQAVDAQYDPQSWIYISANSLRLRERTLVRPAFLLSALHSQETLTLTGEDARYYPAVGKRPAGWLIRNPKPSFEALSLTDEGRRTIFRRSTGVFVVSGLSPDQLYNRGGSYRYLTTPELIQRIRLPAGSLSSARAYVMHLHSRFTRPILTLIGVFLVLPLIARREKMSLVQNVAICMASLGIVYGLCLAGQLLGQSLIMKPEIAAWAPLMFGGALCAWLTGAIRT